MERTGGEVSRTAFYCRCGERLEGASARLSHRCPTGAAQPIGPPGLGLYLEGEDLHFDVPEFLRYVGWTDTEENRDKAMYVLKEVAQEILPGVPVVEQ